MGLLFEQTDELIRFWNCEIPTFGLFSENPSESQNNGIWKMYANVKWSVLKIKNSRLKPLWSIALQKYVKYYTAKLFYLTFIVFPRHILFFSVPLLLLTITLFVYIHWTITESLMRFIETWFLKTDTWKWQKNKLRNKTSGIRWTHLINSYSLKIYRVWTIYVSIYAFFSFFCLSAKCANWLKEYKTYTLVPKA